MTERYVRMCDCEEVQERFPYNGYQVVKIRSTGDIKSYFEQQYIASMTNRVNQFVWLPRVEDWMGLCGYEDIAWFEFAEDMLFMDKAYGMCHDDSPTMPEIAAMVYMRDRGYEWNDEEGWTKRVSKDKLDGIVEVTRRAHRP